MKEVVVAGDVKRLTEAQYLLALQRSLLAMIEIAKESGARYRAEVAEAKELIRCRVLGCGLGGACDGKGESGYPCPLGTMRNPPAAAHSVLERIQRWDRDQFASYTDEWDLASDLTPRYLAFTRDPEVHLDTGPAEGGNDYRVVGGSHPTLFKTLRNARRAADSAPWGLKGRPGFVVVFDPGLLPAIDTEDIYEGADHDEHQFAERQIALWAERAARLQAKQLAVLR